METILSFRSIALIVTVNLWLLSAYSSAIKLGGALFGSEACLWLEKVQLGVIGAAICMTAICIYAFRDADWRSLIPARCRF